MTNAIAFVGLLPKKMPEGRGAFGLKERSVERDSFLMSHLKQIERR